MDGAGREGGPITVGAVKKAVRVRLFLSLTHYLFFLSLPFGESEED